MATLKRRDTVKLYNLIIPFVFWEVWHVLLALLVVAAVESAVLSISLGIQRRRFFAASMAMNAITTLFGYVLQGIARFIALIVVFNLLPVELADSPLADGIFGNFGIGFSRPLVTFAAHFAVSLILAFSLSLTVEYFVLKKLFKLPVRRRKLLQSLCLANLASYALILAWLLFNFFTVYLTNLDA